MTVVYIQKRKLSYNQQIEHLKQKGVQFHKISEQDALHYLQYNTYLFKLSAYRKNYPKDITNTRYLHLDFSNLVDLAVIDMYLRALIVKLSLNIEHFAKVKLLRQVTDNKHEDGYCIVREYLNSLDESSRHNILSELERNARSPYCKEAYAKYKDNFPVWVFIEIISFGSFLSFYKFCAERFSAQFASFPNKPLHNSRDMINDFYLMLSVKRIRNAAAHNNCILNDLRAQKHREQVSFELIRSLRNDLGFGSESIRKKVSNIRVAQILTCLYMHKKLASSQGIQRHLSTELHEFADRLFQKNTYDDNQLIKSTFTLLASAIDKWYPIG